nr:sulfotransferase [Anaerolineae bacterium]
MTHTKDIKDDALPSLLIVGGQPRSGTTMLWKICNSHPDIQLLFEFRSFSRLGQPYSQYVDRLRKSWWDWDYLGKKRRPWQLPTKGRNALFLAKYLKLMARYRDQQIDLEVVREVLHQMFPEQKVVGDKFPAYVRNLASFCRMDGLRRVIIYRDCRDVIQSTLNRVSTDWKNETFAQDMNTPVKIAARWVAAIEQMEKHADHIHIIRYEDLATEPRPVLLKLATYLDVAPEGFDYTIVRPTSIGKYRSELTREQQAAILDITGPAMQRLGYQ